MGRPMPGHARAVEGDFQGIRPMGRCETACRSSDEVYFPQIFDRNLCMHDVKVTTSTGWELVHSVSVILSSNMATVTYAGLYLDVVFKQDNSGEVRYTGKPNGSRWGLELLNFSNSIGEGMFDLIPFAEQEGRRVMISFFVQTMSVEANSRVLLLNFFKEPAKQ